MAMLQSPVAQPALDERDFGLRSNQHLRKNHNGKQN